MYQLGSMWVFYTLENSVVAIVSHTFINAVRLVNRNMSDENVNTSREDEYSIAWSCRVPRGRSLSQRYSHLIILFYFS